jgi:thymidylate synthase
MEPGVDEISPLCVAVRGLDEGRPVEDRSIRDALDRTLAAHDKLSVHTVASTIFPRSRWKPELGRERLFERYAKMLPIIKKADSKRNRNGTYFERMTAFGPEKINQLEHIIDTYAGGNRRRSALQAVIFDPAKDHTDQPQRGFPCLQYVSFAPFDQTKLRVTGVYATQYLFEKAYGNYLGLYYLGHFMAHELGLELAQINCIASVAKRGTPSKKDLRTLATELEGFLSESEGGASIRGAVA